MDEIWKEIIRNYAPKHGLTIMAVSNRGNMRLLNGTIKPIPLRQMTKVNDNIIVCSRLIAETFIPKTEDDIVLGRNWVDHITHHPTDMNVNDVRNLRWCTPAENNNFEEHCNNLVIAHLGKKLSEETKKKIARANTGRIFSDEHRKHISDAAKSRTGKCQRTEFGKLFVKHFGVNSVDDPKLYRREYMYYYRHNKCSWEINNT